MPPSKRSTDKAEREAILARMAEDKAERLEEKTTETDIPREQLYKYLGKCLLGEEPSLLV